MSKESKTFFDSLYTPEGVRVFFGGQELVGSSDLEFISIRKQSPWWKIVDLPVGHVDYIEGSTRLECLTKEGVVASFSLYNDSKSLSDILESDPMEPTLMSITKLNKEKE